MRARIMLAGWAVALAVSTAWAGQTGVRAIDLRGLELGDATGGNVEAPLLITNLDELYNAIADEQVAAAVSRQVDFTKENVLYFRWEGSSQDSLRPTLTATAEGPEVTFVLRPGMTLDLFPHHRLFAIPKGASWRVEVVIAGAEK